MSGAALVSAALATPDEAGYDRHAEVVERAQVRRDEYARLTTLSNALCFTE